ncbi:MAG TPA: hypothetical protein VEN31_07780 [Candidatus Bathyarchaeia archaeon]|nr:hypothetical protein [Candidatus Bathyarchaeia archaeon]
MPVEREVPIRAFILFMSSNPRVALAALIRQRASAIAPRVISDATSDRQRTERIELEHRLTAYLERRIPLWVEALEASDAERAPAIRRLLRTDAEAGENIPPVVLLGTVAIGYRLMESEIRLHASDYGFSADALWAEMDLLRRTVGEMRRRLGDGESVA